MDAKPIFLITKLITVFTKKEQLEILEKLGYNIVHDKDSLSRKAKIYGGADSGYIMVEGKKTSVEVVFKNEIRKRIFNI